MNKVNYLLFCFLSLFFLSEAVFASTFICEHQQSNGTQYLAEFRDGSLCLRRVNGDSSEEKFDLFVVYKTDGSSVTYYNDDKSFRLILPVRPGANFVSGEISHADPNGEVIQEIMPTVCE